MDGGFGCVCGSGSGFRDGFLGGFGLGYRLSFVVVFGVLGLTACWRIAVWGWLFAGLTI